MIYLAFYEPENRVSDRKREHELGRNLLRFGLLKEFGKTWEIGISEHGKPFLKGAEGICFNISHTKGLVVCAIDRQTVGVDAEYIRPWKENLARRVCSEAEWTLLSEKAAAGESGEKWFSRLWTLKESFVKATGEGISFPLNEIAFSFEEKGSIRANIPGWEFSQFPVCGKYMVSVCKADRRERQV